VFSLLWLLRLGPRELVKEEHPSDQQAKAHAHFVWCANQALRRTCEPRVIAKKINGLMSRCTITRSLVLFVFYTNSGCTCNRSVQQYVPQVSIKYGPDVRSQFQTATALLVRHLKAAASNEVGDPERDQELVARVLSEHQQYLLAVDQLFAAVDAGDRARVLAIDQTALDPLMKQMKQQVNTLVNEHSQEASQRLTELEQTQHRNLVITPIVFSIGLALLGLCWGVLQTYRRKLDQARQTELSQLEETARLKTQQGYSLS
jgi:hypothetical protein